MIESRNSRAGRWRVGVLVLLLLVGGMGGYLVGSATSDPDVSEAGQASNACALADKIREGHQSEADWGDLGEDRAYTEMSALGLR